jgi:putative membrane protein
MKNFASKAALSACAIWAATAMTLAQQPHTTSTSANPVFINTGAPADVGTPSATPNPSGANLPQGTPSMTPQPQVPGNPSSLNPGGDIVRGVDGSSSLPAARASARDRNYVISAAQAGMAEVQMAQLALKKSNNPRVRDFAQMMVKDHSDLNAKLTPMATQLGVSLPTRLSAADQGALSRLSRQSGSTFDRNYMAAQRGAHSKALALFQDAGAQADNVNLRNFFAQNTNTISTHLEMLK